MTTEQTCTNGCGPATLTRTVPLCSRCGLKVSEEALGFVFDGLRSSDGVIRLPAPPEPKMSTKVANDVAFQMLATLRRQGATRVTFPDLKPLMESTGRSRSWIYLWLDEQVSKGELAKDKSTEPVSYVFTD